MCHLWTCWCWNIWSHPETYFLPINYLYCCLPLSLNMPCQCKSPIQNGVSAKDIRKTKILHHLQFNKARRQRSQRNDSASQLNHNVSRQSPHRSNNRVEASLSHSELDSMTNIKVFCPPKYCSSKAKTPSQPSTLNQPKSRYRRGRENRRLLLEVRLKK